LQAAAAEGKAAAVEALQRDLSAKQELLLRVEQELARELGRRTAAQAAQQALQERLDAALADQAYLKGRCRELEQQLGTRRGLPEAALQQLLGMATQSCGERGFAAGLMAGLGNDAPAAPAAFEGEPQGKAEEELCVLREQLAVAISRCLELQKDVKVARNAAELLQLNAAAHLQQDAQLKQQAAKLLEQDAQLKQQAAKLQEQDAQLKQQAAKLLEQDAQLKQQAAKLEEQGAQLKQQAEMLKHLRAEVRRGLPLHARLRTYRRCPKLLLPGSLELA
jgi:DNA repair exonuclease SbcCD ATPase subunit